MKQPLYVFSDVVLKRQSNTLSYERIARPPDEDNGEPTQEECFLYKDIDVPSGDKKYIPIESIESIFAFGTLRFNSRFLYFLSRYSIPMHCFSMNGYYSGSYLPPKGLESGTTLIQQVEHFRDDEERLLIAKEFIRGASHNTMMNLKYHLNRGKLVSEELQIIEELHNAIDSAKFITELMGIEGNIKRTYYLAWERMITQPIDFQKRVKNPPNNLINALISYGNMILYSYCLNEIYHTKLYPQIGFLHQPGDHRYALSYDIAEIFKPLIVDRAIFKLLNKNMISERDAFIKNGFCRLKDAAKKAYVDELNEKMHTVIENRDTERNMSYRLLIRDECYKLIKHLEGTAEYVSFRARW